MNNKFDELAKGLAQLVTRLHELKRFCVGSVGIAVAWFGLTNSVPTAEAALRVGSPSGTCTITDSAGDAVFPTDLYEAPVPPYLDIIQASVGFVDGTFHFEVQMNAQISSNPSPDFTVSPNHLGTLFGILTDPATAVLFKFKGQPDVYHANFVLGALYSFADSGLGLGLGWNAFMIDQSTGSLVTIPFQIRGDTLAFQVSAALLGNPASFQWAAITECDPVPAPDEHNTTRLAEDFVPDHGTAAWPCCGP
jgi:hypothetical protein